MPKIALCISGQVRSCKEGYRFVWENLLKYHDVTVFCHAWDSPEKENILIYNPAKFSFEKALDNDLSKYTNVPPPQPNWKVKDPARSTYNQLYSIFKCNELKQLYETENDIVFDWVIRTRFDFALNVKIPFETLDSNKLYIPNCRMSPNRDFGNDQFAFSCSSNMNKYADAFNCIDKFYDQGTIMIGEEMMAANWRDKGLIGDKLVYFNPNHPFPPGPYNGTWHSLLREDFESWQK